MEQQSGGGQPPRRPGSGPDSGEQTPKRSRYISHMPGYDDELIPPRPPQEPPRRDNSIVFPGGGSDAPRRRTAPPPSRTERPRQSAGQTRSDAEARSRRSQSSQSGTARRRPDPRKGTPSRTGAAKSTGRTPSRAGTAQSAGRTPNRTGTAQSAGRAPNRPRPQSNTARRRPAGQQERERVQKRKLTKRELRRRRVIRRTAALLTMLVLAVLGIVVTVTTLFRVTAVEIRNVDGFAVETIAPYSRTEILNALDIELQKQNLLFGIRPEERAARMEKALPMLEKIEVVRSFPGTIIVKAAAAKPRYGLKLNNGWATVSSSLKILSTGFEQPALLALVGGEPNSTVPGEVVSYLPQPVAEEAAKTDEKTEEAAKPEPETQTDTKLELLGRLFYQFELHELLPDISRIEFEDSDQLAFLYQNRISVLLGTVNELDYKMDYAEFLLTNTSGKGLAPTDTGRLDCSHIKVDGTINAIFAQGAPIMPSGYNCMTDPAPLWYAVEPETPAAPAAEEIEGGAPPFLIEEPPEEETSPAEGEPEGPPIGE